MAPYGAVALGEIDGPGQGESLRLRNLYARHDYAVPGAAAYDYVAARSEVDPKKVVVMGCLDDADAAIRKAEKFSLVGVAEKITCPFLIVHAQADNRQVGVDYIADWITANI